MPIPKLPSRIERLLPRLELAFGVALIAAGIASRFYMLGHESLWLDEATTFLRARLPLRELFEDTILRHHVPPYFVMMHYVLGLGDDEFTLRLPSAIFGSLALLATVGLGTVVAGARVGVLAGVAFALAPQLLRYIQEARMYAMFVFFSTSALCGLLWLVKHLPLAASWPFPRGAQPGVEEAALRNARRAWLAYAGCTLGVLYTHNTGVLFWGVCWVVGAIAWWYAAPERGRFLRNWLVLNFAIFVFWAPWLKVLLVQAKEVDEFFWAQVPSAELIAKTLDQLYLYGSHRALPGAIAMVLALLGLVSLRQERALALALCALAFLHPIVILLISLHRPIWLPRLMLWATVPFFVLIGAGIADLGSRLFIALALAVFTISGTSALLTGYYHVQRKPHWELALRDAAADGASVLVIGERERRLITYYRERRTRPITEVHAFNTAPEELDNVLVGKRRVWIFIGTQHAYGEAMLERMRVRGRQLRRVRYGRGLFVYEFRIWGDYYRPRVPLPPPSFTLPLPW